jgi:SAM-dependent methyltransferase
MLRSIVVNNLYDANRRAWDERARFHADTPMYQESIERLLQGGDALLPFDDRVLGDLADCDVLHLQCHIGTDTLSLARRGARVVGVDFSTEAIVRARTLGKELQIEAQFVVADVYRLHEVLSGRFDLVYTSYGVLCWLGDLAAWARTAAHFLAPAGRLIVIDDHPLAAAIAEDGLCGGRIALDWPYLSSGTAIRYEASGSYADPSAKTEQREQYEWSHGLAEVLQSVIHAGLRIERVEEYAEGFYPRHPEMIRNPDRTWRLPEPLHGRYPLTFALVARSEVARR